MTKEDESAKIGRLSLEQSELRRHIALLEDELKRAGRELESFPLFLRRADAGRVLELVNAVDFESLKTTATKLQRGNERLAEVLAALSHYGI